MNRQILLAARPVGDIKHSDFELVERDMPVPGDNEVLIQTQYLAVEPAMRGWMENRADYVAPMETRYDTMDRKASYDGRDFLNMYMTSFLQNLIDQGWEVASVPIDNGWLETDTIADLDLYHAMLKDGSLTRFCRLE